MKGLLAFSVLATVVVPALGAVGEWQQCGGQDYKGDTECSSGLTCVTVNPYYFQCQKGGAASSSVPASSAPPTSSTTAAGSAPTPVTGFVKTSGTKFTLNGAKFTAVGTNSYWAALAGYSEADQNKAWADMAAVGATVVRTWGFNDVTPATVGNYPVYYQSFNGSAAPVINTGANGLQKFDLEVKIAKANGIRLLVPLVNNWGDYGGMDVYVKALANSDNHDLFYTNTAVKNAFKTYIKTFVSRYANEPGIFGWELANEPRCKGSTGTTSGTCTPATITAWAKEMSAYIKSLDSNHLVAIGDEGFYNKPGNPSYPYQGGEGIDFDENLKITTVDFGTAHMYPDHWGVALADHTTWGVQWIKDHAASGVAANKPVILEEFGVLANKETIYKAYWDAVVSSGLAGDLIWQASSVLSGGNTWDDGYGVFPGSAVYNLQKAHAAALKARA